MPYMIDYKIEVKRLIQENYKPSDVLNKDFEMTTAQLVTNLRRILPENAVDDHMVYEVLIDMKFEPKENGPLEFMWFFERV